MKIGKLFEFFFMKKDMSFEWIFECQISIQTLDYKIVYTPFLIKWNETIHTDVGDLGIGIRSILAQIDEHGVDHTIYYASRKLQL